MRTALLAAALLLCAPASSGQGVDWAEVHNVTVRGIDRLYNLDIEEAAATFDSVRHMAPGDPRGYFFGSMVHFWLFTLTRNESEYTAFLNASEDVVTVCENLLDQNEEDHVARFYLGGIYGYRGLAHQANNSILKAVTDGRRGYSYLREAVERKPDLYDAQMGFGLFSYLAGKVPRSLKWIMSLLGFAGDVEGGLRMLKAAADNGTYTRGEASFFLAQFLFSERRRDEAFTYLGRLIDRYPDNTLFLLLNANWQSRSGNHDEALTAAKRAVAINERKKLRYGEEFAYSTLGSLYYTRNDFANCRENFEKFLTIVRSKEYVSNWTYYRLGVAQEITGDRARALTTYAAAVNITDRDRSRDRFYYRLAHDRVQTPMTDADKLAIRGENELARKNYAQAQSLFEEAIRTSPADHDCQARALAGIQEGQFERDLFAEAVETGLRLVTLKPSRERWLIPHGHFRLGRAYARLGKTAEARSAFEKVSEFDEYDFQSSLEERVEEEMAKLKQAG
jgi:tetratricopeptide (TPR) repeat protein